MTCLLGSAGLLLAGCTAGASTPEGIAGSASASVTAVPSDGGIADLDQTAILAAYHGYWAAAVAVEGGDVDAQLFSGVATGTIVEEELAYGRQYLEWGVARVGAPTFSDVTVEPGDAGASATVWACVDYSAWVIPDAEPTGEAMVLAGGLVVEDVDGVWLVTRHTTEDPGFTC